MLKVGKSLLNSHKKKINKKNKQCTRLDKTRLEKPRHGKTRHDKTREDKTRDKATEEDKASNKTNLLVVRGVLWQGVRCGSSA